jgi:aspartate/methionine/tyrosine aminotransferase
MDLLKEESAFAVLARAQELERQGRDIIHLEIGDTDFDTPAHIVEEAYGRLREGETHYCSSSGLLALREACCEYLRKDGRGDYTPDEIVVGPGGKAFLYTTIMALAGPGDQVLYPDPGFPVYESVALYAGAEPIPIPILEANDFAVDTARLRSLVTDRSRLLILNYPHNPTGGTLDREGLEQIAEIAVENDLAVLSDEVYAHMLFEGEHLSIATRDGMLERTITLESFSKTYAMTGWRLGFVAAPAEVAGKLTRIISNSTSCVPPFIQMAGIEALQGSQAESEAMMADYRRRRDLFVGGLNEIPGISCLSPRGAFYAFPNVAGLPMGADEFSDHLLAEAGVATMPGSAFGIHGTEHLRMCFAASVDDLQRGLERIGTAVEALA